MMKFSCSLCGAVWQKVGKTNCWSADPAEAPAKPAYCPSREHMEVITESFALYNGDGKDAAIARVATRVEGLCYEHVSGSNAVSMPAGPGSKTRSLLPN
jgi:hypothetical protein